MRDSDRKSIFPLTMAAAKPDTPDIIDRLRCTYFLATGSSTSTSILSGSYALDCGISASGVSLPEGGANDDVEDDDGQQVA